MNTVAAPETHFTTERHPLTLFFDGECAFCDRWVGRLRAADDERLIRFGAKQGSTFRELTQLHPELATVESMILVKRGPDGSDQILVRSRAVREVITKLPQFRPLSLLLKIVPTPIADIGYRIFARFRIRIFGKLAQCRVPRADERELFVD
jgi:predicted DCC family thiol-disulfide oxidoreductase YuxK